LKVLLPLVTSTSGLSGVQRHALNLAVCLSEDEDIDVHLVIAPWQQNLVQSCGLHNVRIRVEIADVPRNTWGRNIWFYSGLPRLARKTNVDLVHAIYPVPVLASALKVPLVVTLHDLYPFQVPENFGSAKAVLHRAIVRHCLTHADAIACVSHATADSVANYFPTSICAKISVIHNCITRQPVDSASPPRFIDCGSFLLSVAQHRHNKNLPLLLRTLSLLLDNWDICDVPSLVIVGMRGPQTKEIVRLIRTLGLSQRVMLLEGISDAELMWCYRNCSAVVVPSITEGFCLPAAEALLAGSPLICADIPVLREIVGGHCTFVPLGPGAEARFAQAIRASLEAPRPRPVDLPQYSQQLIASQCMALYRRLTSNHVPNSRHNSEAISPPGPAQV